MYLFSAAKIASSPFPSFYSFSLLSASFYYISSFFLSSIFSAFLLFFLPAPLWLHVTQELTSGHSENRSHNFRWKISCAVTGDIIAKEITGSGQSLPALSLNHRFSQILPALLHPWLLRSAITRLLHFRNGYKRTAATSRQHSQLSIANVIQHL